MREMALGIVLFAAATLTANAQMSKQVAVQQGSPEDRALAAIEAAANPHQKLALLDKFATDHPSGDMALMADNLYVNLYSSLKNYSLAYKYGDKALAIDPFDLDVAVQLIRDAQLEHNTEKMVSYAVRVGQMVAEYKAQPTPTGVSPEEWKMQQKKTLESVEPQVNWVVDSVYTVISRESASGAKNAQLGRMAKAFPGSAQARRER